jgi:hypothetical protein
MKHLVGGIVRILIDYMDYVPLCAKLKSVLEVQREWPEIRQIIGKNRYFLYFKFYLLSVCVCVCVSVCLCVCVSLCVCWCEC